MVEPAVHKFIEGFSTARCAQCGYEADDLIHPQGVSEPCEPINEGPHEPFKVTWDFKGEPDIVNDPITGPGDPEPGVKHDLGKLKYHLMPIQAEEEVIKVLMNGAEKYSEFGWVDVVRGDPMRYFNANMRHLKKWQRGEIADKESKLHPLAHAICCLMFILANDLESEV